MTGVVKAVTRGAGGQGGNRQVILRRVLTVALSHGCGSSGVRPRPPGTRPGRRPFPGPSPGAPAPAVPPATASHGPPPATAPGSRPANARDVILRALQRPQNHIAVAPARHATLPGTRRAGTGPPRS